MSQRFRALVCHDGLFDMREMGDATEELWFSEHDVGGFTPYENPQAGFEYVQLINDYDTRIRINGVVEVFNRTSLPFIWPPNN
ncbi:unnamed protein product [Rotaria socialis]|uniref:Uncharacterized protein n=1 Tax=Rotaria socialis TaxID=392032 RepID=A0A817TNG6_9BILA|nr:unnamed protein product [Rotaria socialis]